MRSDDGGKSIPRGPLHGLQRMNGTGQHMERHHSSLEQGNLLKGIDNWSGAARSVVQGPNIPFDNT